MIASGVTFVNNNPGERGTSGDAKVAATEFHVGIAEQIGAPYTAMGETNREGLTGRISSSRKGTYCCLAFGGVLFVVTCCILGCSK